MPHARFLALLACRSIRRRSKSAELRQTIRPRLSRDARLEQNPAGSKTARRDHRENRRKVSGSVDRKSTRLNSSHLVISYAVFCLKKKKHCTRTDMSMDRKNTRTNLKSAVVTRRLHKPGRSPGLIYVAESPPTAAFRLSGTMNDIT